MSVKKRWGRCAIYLQVASVLVGCVVRCADAQEPPKLSEDDRAAIRHIMTVSKPGEPFPLDLSNDLHHRFLNSQMALAGVNAETYPQLHRVVRQSRLDHARVGPAPLARLECCGATPAVAPATSQPIQTITALGTANGTLFNTSALSSIPSRPYVSKLIVGLYDENQNPIGTPQQDMQFNSGEDLNVQAAGTRLVGSSNVASIATYFWQNQHGTPQFGTVHAISSSPVSNITNTAPMPGPQQSIIQLCLGRAGDKCTYSPPGGSGTNVIMPVAGSITFGNNINLNPAIPNSCLITMATTDAGDGGGCTIQSTDSFFADPNTVINGNQISWNLNAHFETAQGCLAVNSNAIYTFTLQVTVGNQPTFVSITNDPDTPSNPSVLKIPDLIVLWSCLADGTLIDMADGTQRPIEKIEPGDKIITNAAGLVMEVEGKLKGNEDVPMLRLITENGCNVLLTGGHPVVTPKGVTLARLLKVGDAVATKMGASKIVSLDKEMFAGHVWNLSVGPRQEDFKKFSDDRTFFASGVLVGDNQMQFTHNRKHKYKRESVLATLPKEWHQDYLNHLKLKGRTETGAPKGK